MVHRTTKKSEFERRRAASAVLVPDGGVVGVGLGNEMHGNELEVSPGGCRLHWVLSKVWTMDCLAVHWSKVMDLLLMRVLTKPVKVLAMGCMAYKSQIEPSHLNKNRTPKKKREVPPGGCRVQVCKSGMNNWTVKNCCWLLSSVSK